MSRSRPLSFESLQARQLLAAADVPVGSAEVSEPAIDVSQDDRETAAEIELRTAVASAFGLQRSRFLEVEDGVFVLGRQSIHLVEASPASEVGFAITASLDLPGIVKDAVQVPDGLLVVSGERTDMPASRSSTVSLLHVAEGGELEVVDSYTRSAEFAGLWPFQGGVSIHWSNENLEEGLERFGDADLTFGIEGDSAPVRGTDVIYDQTGQLADRRISTADWGSLAWTVGRQTAVGDDGTFVSVGQEQTSWVQLRDGSAHVVSFDTPEGLTENLVSSLSGAGVDEAGNLTLDGLFEADSGVRYLRMTLAPNGDVVGTQTLESDPSAAQQEARFDNLQPLKNNGLSETTLYRVPGSEDVAIRSVVGDSFVTQMISLPFTSTGFIPGFVLGDDEVVLFRSDVEGARLADGSLKVTSSPDLYAYLLTRDASGQFAVADTVQIGAVDFRAHGHAQSNGTVVLRGSDAAVVLRSRDGELRQETLSVQSPTWVGTVGDAILRVRGDDIAILAASNEAATEGVVSNPSQHDVNADGHVTALDALLVINQLGRQGASEVEQQVDSAMAVYDTNEDGAITAIDALLVINQLGRQGQAAESESVQDEVDPNLRPGLASGFESRDDDDEDDEDWHRLDVRMPF